MYERDEIQYECPYCAREINPAPEYDSRTWMTCYRCGEVLNLASQRALSRAEENFLFARELTTPELLTGPKRLDLLSPQSKDALRSYQRSYTGIQFALQAQLPANQLASATEMMAEIARILQKHQMISGLEARYWVQLMVCQTARQEIETLERQLQKSRQTLLLRLFRHPHWRLRRSQLRRALTRRCAQLEELEQSLTFVNTLYVMPPEPET